MIMKKTARQKTFLYNMPGYIYFERLYVFFLKIFRSKEKYPLITDDDLSKMQAIAKKSYPDYLQDAADFDSEEKLLRYCSCLDLIQIYHVVSDSYYVIMGAHWNCFSIVDFAAINGTCSESTAVYDFIVRNFKRKPVAAKCREKTSYPLLKALERSGRIKIVDTYTRTEFGEICHVVKFKVKRIRG